MKSIVYLVALFFAAGSSQAQLQVDLKLKRPQHVAHEPVMATVKIRNLAGSAIDLHAGNGQSWFGLEMNAGEGRLLTPVKQQPLEPALHLEAGEVVTRNLNLASIFPVDDFGVYHVRANIYFADQNRFFYSPAKVFQVVAARPIWQETVGIPDGASGAGEARTYSLLANRFPGHTSLYVRVENRSSGVVLATYSLGRIIAADEPDTGLDRANQLHVLHCVAPRRWAYSRIGLNGELLAHSIFVETRTRPRLRHGLEGAITVSGGMPAVAEAHSSRRTNARGSGRTAELPAAE